MIARAVLVLVTILSCSMGAGAADPRDIERKVAELNTQSMKLLGVSLNAVRFLVDASSTSYLLLSYLESSGEINFIRELEAKGYVRTQIVQGLPEGTQNNIKHIRVIPIGEGGELPR